MMNGARALVLALFALWTGIAVAQAQTAPADPPALCAAPAKTWASLRASGAGKEVGDFLAGLPRACDALRGEVWARGGELAGWSRPVAPQRGRDPCTPARVAWGVVREAGAADVKAYREGLPAECEAQRFWADARLAALAAGAPTSPLRGPGSVFRDCPTCPQMVVLPAGSLLMGSPETEKGRRANEGPQRTVAIASFAAGRFEITFEQWDACAAEGGCTAKGVNDMRWGRGDRPVLHVSYEHAESYAAWLTAKTGKRYRLLTEAEWEYAARGGTMTPFWWGETGGSGYAHCVACESLWPRDRTAPVGSFPANPFGLYDTAGNVWEWTSGCFAEALGPSPAKAKDQDTCMRAIRGGSYVEGPFGIRSANRTPLVPGLRAPFIGFRIARDLP